MSRSFMTDVLMTADKVRPAHTLNKTNDRTLDFNYTLQLPL